MCSFGKKKKEVTVNYVIVSGVIYPVEILIDTFLNINRNHTYGNVRK